MRKWLYLPGPLSGIAALTVGVTILVVAVAVTAVTVLDVRHEHAVASDSLANRGHTLVRELNEILAEYAYMGDVDSLKDVAATMVKSDPIITRVRVFWPDGRLITDSSGPKYPTENIGGDVDLTAVQGLKTVYSLTGDHASITGPIVIGNQAAAGIQIRFDTGPLNAEIAAIVRQHIWQGLIILAASLALAYGLGSFTSRPIRTLNAAAARISSGDLSTQVLATGPREVSSLGRTMEEMRVELSRFRDHLGEQVAVRTRQLTETNERLRQEITERSRLEKERSSVTAKALTQSKFATLGQVATGVAHEINQPLTYINTTFNALQEDLELNELDPEAAQQRLDESRRQVARINEIIRHLRTFGAADEVQMAPVDISKVLENTMLLMDQRLQNLSIALEQQIEESLPLVMGNVTELEQVFINLFQNSIDALARKRGDARISIRVDTNQDDKSVRVAFEDNGSGIAPEHIERLFEPFFTTKSPDRGSGLGLAIVYGIVQGHGGDITVSSEQPKGTTVTIHLPVKEG